MAAARTSGAGSVSKPQSAMWALSAMAARLPSSWFSQSLARQKTTQRRRSASGFASYEKIEVRWSKKEAMDGLITQGENDRERDWKMQR